MGNFAAVIRGVGNHGCDRGVRSGEHVLGCQQPNCVDCIFREVTRRLKRNGVSDLHGQLIHWGLSQDAVPFLLDVTPDNLSVTSSPGHEILKRYQIDEASSTPAVVEFKATSVLDDLVTGIRYGQF